MDKSEMTIGEQLMEIYRVWVATLKKQGAPEYMATPDNFGANVARMLWKEIGKGKGQRGGK